MNLTWLSDGQLTGQRRVQISFLVRVWEKLTLLEPARGESPSGPGTWDRVGRSL